MNFKRKRRLTKNNKHSARCFICTGQRRMYGEKEIDKIKRKIFDKEMKKEVVLS